MVQLRMRGWQGRRGELEAADGTAVGWLELGGRSEPDRIHLDGRTHEVASTSDRRRWVVRSGDAPPTDAAALEVRRPSRVKLRYELVLADGRVFGVGPVSRVRRRLNVTDTTTDEVVGGFERGGTFRTVWTFDLEAQPAAVQAACVWVAAAIDREDEASNVAAVGSGA